MRSYKASDHAWLTACNMGYATPFDSFWQEGLTADLERLNTGEPLHLTVVFWAPPVLACY